MEHSSCLRPPSWSPNTSPRALYCVVHLALCSRRLLRTQREFYAYVLVYFGAVYVFQTLFYNQDTASSTAVVFQSVIFGAVTPLFVWHLLIGDTYKCSIGAAWAIKRLTLMVIIAWRRGMQDIVSVQGLYIVLELHRNDIIAFAHLELRRKIGSGASANVFGGVLHSATPVVVIVYFPTEISETVMVEFSIETALCAPSSIPTFAGSSPPPLVNSSRHQAGQLLLGSNDVVNLTDFGEPRSMETKTSGLHCSDRKMTLRGNVQYMP
ncbi:hypothetical protein H257_12134 [Aphanomyces astaci]|uniref:Uncharacterized protein n=1 Tax=Aphanomyces astaci TaxID=112090 RepID=W4FZ59_APHAT|nr:hypothetical protein H257_12134 [Aphanomyces astaci]ETV72765.1 hypothetical protein H257_12134 [Aphanomyces astaci]|eukprot:XP_009837551.1 hypothetical protein H257_12134 [Aphanomyces astaci]